MVIKPDTKYCRACGKKMQEAKYTSKGTLLLDQYPYLIKGKTYISLLQEFRIFTVEYQNLKKNRLLVEM